MVTRSSPQVVKDLESLKVLVLRDKFMRATKKDLEGILLRSASMTLDWAADNLTRPNAVISIINFRLPLGSLIARRFRLLYLNAFNLGALGQTLPPLEKIRFQASLSAALFVSRIERDLKEAWKRSDRNIYILSRVTKEVFSNVIS